jgi:hypothetical protein
VSRFLFVVPPLTGYAMNARRIGASFRTAGGAEAATDLLTLIGTTSRK